MDIKYNKIREVMKEAGFNQTTFAELLGISPTEVNRWCNNITQPRYVRLWEIAKKLNCEPRDLLCTVAESEAIPA